MTRRMLLGMLGCLALLSSGLVTARAHNNPTFVEVLLLSVPIHATASDRGESEPFTLDLPKGSTELIWKVVGSDADKVRFSLSVDGEVVAPEMQSGARSKLFRDKTFRVVDVVGGGSDLAVEVYSSVLDRSKKPES